MEVSKAPLGRRPEERKEEKMESVPILVHAFFKKISQTEKEMFDIWRRTSNSPVTWPDRAEQELKPSCPFPGWVSKEKLEAVPTLDTSFIFDLSSLFVL